jgi:hypothetical protein
MRRLVARWGVGLTFGAALAVAGGAWLGCAGRGSTSVAETADAALGPPSTLAPQRLGEARKLARADAVFRAVLGEDGLAQRRRDALREVDGALRSDGFDEAAGGVPMAFGGRAPRTADGAIEARAGDARVTLQIEGARGVDAALVDGAAIYPDAHAQTDLLLATAPGRVELFWLLRDAAAPARFSLRLALEGLTARRVDAAIEFADARGVVRVRMPRPSAVDANGARREATLALDGDRVVVELDPRGLAYPVLLDPALEQVIWTDLGPDVPVWPPPGGTGYPRLTVPTGLQRVGATMRSADDRVFLFGGTTIDGGPYTQVTPLVTRLFQFDGTSWTESPGGNFGDSLIWADPNHAGLDRVAEIVWDPNRKRLIAFAGLTSGPSGPRLNVYEYDPSASSPAWTVVCGQPCYDSSPATDPGTPPPLSAAWAFGKIVVVGPFGTLVWDPASASFKPFGATPDLARAGAGIAFDAARSRLVVYGDTTGLSDTWESNGTTWTKVLATGPLGVKNPQLTYHTGRKRVVLWASTWATGGLWSWDGAAWSAITLAGAGPSLRPNASMTYDEKRGKLVMFGGGDLGGGSTSSCYDSPYAWPYDNNRDFRTCARVDTWTSSLFGGACATTADCGASTTCVDGVCCKTACAGSCQRCDAAGSVGTCTSVTSADDPGTCSGTSTCDATGVCRKQLSQTCTLGTDCLSGNCVDGYCCDSACAGPCDTCNQAGKLGTCTPLPKGTAGTGCGNYACTGASGACGTTCATDVECSTAAYCNAAGACASLLAKGAACTRDRQCGSGVCVDGFCCDSGCGGTCDVCAKSLGATADGTCTVLPKTASPAACGPARCSGTSASCGTSCSADADCSTSGFCNGGTCATLRKKGESCDRAAQCGAGLFCADGVCCNAACDGACQACSALNKQSGDASGECGAAKEGTNPHARCTKSSASSCGASGLCDAAGACALYAAGTPCGPSGSTSCDGDVVKGQTCDGLGACVLDTAGTACAPGRCVDGACKTTCAGDADCAGDAYCTGGSCKKKSVAGAKCALDAQCATGFCADGVCCNAPCDRSCEACDQAGTEGTCTAVTGKPRLGHPACAAGDPANPCSASACDGVDRASCAKKAGAETTCRAGSCEDGTESLATTCDGSGTCPAAQTRPCQPFACGGSACKTSCASDADCKAGFQCNATTGACAAGDRCAGSVVTHVDGTTTDCAPYVCESSGKCKTSCAATSDCVSPKLCSEGACVDPPSEVAADTGGCAVAERGAGTGAGLAAWPIGLVVAAVTRRRRRRWDART